MEKRPKIKLKLTAADKGLEFAGWIIFILMSIFAVWSYTRLPDIIPTHFNGRGKPDNYGDKGAIFILPCVAGIIMMMLTSINQFPEIFNYPHKITEENAEQQYALATRLIRLLKLMIVVIFFFIVYATGKVSHGGNGLGRWIIPVLLITMSAPLIFYLVQAIKNK